MPPLAPIHNARSISTYAANIAVNRFGIIQNRTGIDNLSRSMEVLQSESQVGIAAFVALISLMPIRPGKTTMTIGFAAPDGLLDLIGRECIPWGDPWQCNLSFGSRISEGWLFVMGTMLTIRLACFKSAVR
jgi:hypothetical protein